MNEKERRRRLRRDVDRCGWALLLHWAVLNLAVLASVAFELLRGGFQAVISADSWEAFGQGVQEGVFLAAQNGWGYLIACAAAVLGIRLWKGKPFFRELFTQKQTMNAKRFCGYFCVFVGCQLAGQCIATIEELLLLPFGLSVQESMDMATASADRLSLFLYGSLAAPVVEELIFRGLLLRLLEPWGKRFAIVASAVLFGLFHGNLVQIPYAFVVGLVLGVVTMEYSIGWAMVLHMTNNLVLGDSLTRLSMLAPMVGDLLYMLLLLGGTVAGIVLLVVRHRSIRVWLRENPPCKGAWAAFFTAPSIVLFTLLMIISSIQLLFY